jgi:hypothetical protein
MALLVGVVFYVYNLGDQVNRRLEMQNAADAAVISGAGWMARSMNVVAMSNVGEAKLLSLVPVLDALPKATRMALDEVTVWEEALSQQLRRGVPRIRHDIVRTALENLRQRMETQRDILRPFDATLNESGFDMAETTYWRPPGGGGVPPHGWLWRAAVALDELSQATALLAGHLAQADARQFGQASHAEAALLAPLLPRMPARRGEFRDFQFPIEGKEEVRDAAAWTSRSGGSGGAIPDMVYPHRLGPWARLHRWRDYVRRATSWAWVSGTPGTGRVRGGGGVRIGGRRVGGSARTGSAGSGGSSGHWRATDWETYGYTTYGPFAWALRHIHWYADDYYNWQGSYRVLHEGRLSDTFFSRYVDQLARLKLRYMFASAPVQKIHVPDWQYLRYPEAKAFAERNESRIKQTMFYLVEIASRLPPGSPSWLSSGTYRANADRAIAIWAGKWVDPDKLGMLKVADYVWKDEYVYETTEDREIGIHLQLDPDTGQPVWQKVYMTAFYVFGGIDVGEDDEVGNPCNFEGGDELPAPLLLDTAEGDYDPNHPDPDAGVRRERFSFLAAARTHQDAAVWQQRFTNPNPAGAILAVAQAELFNNSSWDLWTQDWQVRLKFVAGWDDWIRRLEAGREDLPELGGLVGEDDLERTIDYLSRLGSEPAELFVNH